jgi:signal transduction histidine kinase
VVPGSDLADGQHAWPPRSTELSVSTGEAAAPQLNLARLVPAAPAAIAIAIAVVAVLRLGINLDSDSGGDSWWLLLDVSTALALAGWGGARVYADRWDGVGYLLQASGLAWSLACVAEAGAVQAGTWTPFGTDAQLIAHVVARSLLIAAIVVVLPDMAADRFMRRGPLDALVAGVTVVSLVLVFVEPATDSLRNTPFGFGNRAWIEVGRQVPSYALIALLVIHVGAAAALAWTRRGLPPTSFQVIGWVLAVAAMPLAFDAIGSRLDRTVLDDLILFVFPALPVLSVISITRAAVAGGRTVRDLRLAQRRMVEAVDEERRRLRRELHDGLGPALAGVALGVRAAGSQVAATRPDSAALLARLGDEVDTCVEEVRRIINDLRPPALDQLGLAGAIESHALRLCSAPEGPALKLSLDGLGGVEMPASVEVAIFRIAAEAVTNVVRHAQASNCRVSVAVDAESVVLEVLDDGVGLPTSLAPGVGLVSMRERAAAVGGDVSIGAGANGGTLVRARLDRTRL